MGDAGGGGELNVVVAGARGLGKSLGVYVEIQCGKLKARTRTEAGKRQVEFGARLRFRKAADVGKIQVLVWGTHRLSRDTVLGSAVVHLDGVVSNGRADASTELTKADGAHAGELLMLLQYTPTFSPVPAKTPQPDGPSAPPAIVEGLPVGDPAYPVPDVQGRTPPPPERPTAPEHAAELYSARIVEEMQALRAGMEELKVATSRRLDQVESGVSALHDRADELDGGYESWTDSESSDEDEDEDEPFMAPPPPPPRCRARSTDTGEPYPTSDVETGLKDIWPASAWSFYEDPELPLLCGQRVRILWKAGEQRTQEKGNNRSSSKTQWWAGYVASYNADMGLHKVQYDDGDCECLDLRLLADLGRFQSTKFGPADVGRRVKILWPYRQSRHLLDSAKGSLRRHCNNEFGVWYAGVISECKRHRFFAGEVNNYFVSDAAVIKYDDGDVELLDFSKQRFQYLTPREERCMVSGTPIDILWQAGQKRLLLKEGDTPLPPRTHVVTCDKWVHAVCSKDLPDGRVRVTYLNGEEEDVDLTVEEWQMREQVQGMW